MQPVSELTEQLFSECKERVKVHLYGHVVKEDAVLPLAFSKGPTGKDFLFNFSNKGDPTLVRTSRTSKDHLALTRWIFSYRNSHRLWWTFVTLSLPESFAFSRHMTHWKGFIHFSRQKGFYKGLRRKNGSLLSDVMEMFLLKPCSSNTQKRLSFYKGTPMVSLITLF